LLPWTVLGCRRVYWQATGQRGHELDRICLMELTCNRNCVTCVRKPLLWTTRT
jgi:hypothetical protein